MYMQRGIAPSFIVMYLLHVGDKPWKSWERTVATVLGGTRRGPKTSEEGEGTSDVVHPFLSPECKLLSRVSLGDVQAAVEQSESAGKREGKIPCAIVNRKGQPWHDALVCMRLESFRELVRRAS